MPTTPDTDALVRRIFAAFADVPYPTGPICVPTYDDEGVTAYFRGTTQAGHRVADLRRHDVALGFFTPDAFHYWLPSFMAAELTDPEAADVIGDGIVFSLLPTARHYAARTARFTLAQSRATCECLRTYRSYVGADWRGDVAAALAALASRVAGVNT